MGTVNESGGHQPARRLTPKAAVGSRTRQLDRPCGRNPVSLLLCPRAPVLIPCRPPNLSTSTGQYEMSPHGHMLETVFQPLNPIEHAYTSAISSLYRNSVPRTHTVRAQPVCSVTEQQATRRQKGQPVLPTAQSRGCCSTCSIWCSGEPSLGWTDFMYCHLTWGGADTMMLSILPPSSPNRTPLS